MTEFAKYGWPLSICIGSNLKSVEKDTEELLNQLSNKYSASIEIEDYSEETEVANFYAGIKALILIVLFLVSLINCLQISKLWILRKKKDLVILRAYGMDNRKIIFNISGELVQMIFVSMLFVFVLNLIYNIIFNSGKLVMSIYIRNSLFLLGAFLVVVLFTIIPAIDSVRRINPAQGLREL
jgi:putative ABC transport system permease protein